MGVIAKWAIEDFLSQRRDDFYWIKRHTTGTLIRKILRMEPSVDLVTTPFHQQAACFIIGAAFHRFCFMMDVGTGKTKLGLDLASYYIKTGECSRFIVVTINDLNTSTWERECEIHSRLKPRLLLGTSSQKEEALLDPEAQLLITTYPALVAFCTKLQETAKGSGTQKRVRWEKQLRKIMGQDPGWILDEIHKAKSRDSLSYRILKTLTADAPAVWGLSGTPFGRNPEDLWAEMYLVDKGESIGETLGMFRAAFMEEVEGVWSTEYRITKEGKDRLSKALRHRSIYFSEEECGDLPEISHVTVPYHLQESSLEQYRKIIEGVIAAQGDVSKMSNVFVQSRRVCAGYTVWETEEAEEVVVQFGGEKFSALEQLLTGLPDDEKLIVFYEYTQSGKYILELLEHLSKRLTGGDWSRVWIYSGTKDPRAEFQRFLDPKGPRIMVANWKSAGTGANPQYVCRRIAFFETPVSPIERRQAFKRVYRTGQKKHCFIYDFVGKGTVEETIQEYLKEGRDLYDALLHGEYSLEK